ncbi:MAG: chloride channel protein [Paracoccaceae bacterium]|nr:chloride channel protein [Paracoccaceae bacterium]
MVKFWFLALFVGIGGGLAAVMFRLGIEAIQTRLYGIPDVTVIESFSRNIGWYWIVGIPMLGGLVVGVIMHLFTVDGRVRSVSDVIEGAAIKNGRIEHKVGLASALSSLVTLSSGGSTGREGPVVHLAALIASWISQRAKVDGVTGRDLMGCAAAAAVSASFNAPIAGAIFAMEVILRHFAIRSFAPIVIASIAGTLINRVWFGDVTEFSLPQANMLEFYVELPAFAILGLCSGLVATVLMIALYRADAWGSFVQHRLGIPIWIKPMVAGALLGSLALSFPHIIGVGYETTSAALTGKLVFHEAMVFAVLKAVAVTITMSGRMGGGVFSPSLMIGALTGLSFGYIAVSIFPDVSGGETLYALAGMGAVAAAVLGSPISTIMIIFEMTGDWQTGLAVMLAVSLSTAVAAALNHKSFFLAQLARRNVQVAAGPQAYLLHMFQVESIMRPVSECAQLDDDALWAVVNKGHGILSKASLGDALPQFEGHQCEWLPVIEINTKDGPPKIIGVLFLVDSLKAYNRALAATAKEEHS